jgi:hypothetical protein
MFINVVIVFLFAANITFLVQLRLVAKNCGKLLWISDIRLL